MNIKINMEYLIGLVLGLAGLAWFFKSKNDVLKALLNNLDFKEDLQKKDKEILKSENQVDLEEEKRKDIDKMLNNKNLKDLDLDELKDFFNRNSNK